MINDPVTAYISNVSSLTTGNNAVNVTASESATINAWSVAAGIAFAGAGESGIAVAGGGATAENLIGADTSAYISNSTLSSVSTVSVTATDDSTINALVGAITVGIAAGGEAGIGVGIGVAYAHNRISDGSESGSGEVEAYLSNTSISGSGLVDVEANAGLTKTSMR